MKIEKVKFLDRYSAWFCIAKPIWISLGLGLILFIVEILLWLMFNRNCIGAGGAMMVGASIVAQTYFYRLPVREAVQGTCPENAKYQRIFNLPQVKQVSSKGSEGIQLLYKIADERDYIQGPDNDKPKIVFECVIYRIDRVLEKYISAFAVIGTIIWAYA